MTEPVVVSKVNDNIKELYISFSLSLPFALLPPFIFLPICYHFLNNMSQILLSVKLPLLIQPKLLYF